MRRLITTVLALVLVGLHGNLARAQSDDLPVLDREFSWPHDGPLLELFDPGDSSYGPGHRGIDIAVLPEDPVHAVADGVVTFAGPVAGTSWITIEHQPGLLSTVGAIATLLVAAGDVVGRDQVIGTATGSVHDDVAGIHLGFRWHQQYIDPLEILPPRRARGPSLLGPGGWRAGDPSEAGTPSESGSTVSSSVEPTRRVASPLAMVSSVGHLPPIAVLATDVASAAA